MFEVQDGLRRRAAFAAAGGWTVLGVSSGLLLARSLGGAFSRPLPEVLILLLVIGVSLASLGLQITFRWSTGPGRTPDWPEACAIGMPILWGIPLLAHGGGFAIGGVFALWLIHASGVLCAAWWSGSESASQPSLNDRYGDSPPSPAPITVDATSAEDNKVDESVDESEEGWPFGEDVDQWQTRSRWEGGFAVSGGVLVEFPPGVRETVVHVNFCPPLPQAPELTTEELDGRGWDIRVATSLAWGGRLTVRRRGSADEAAAGRIGYSAVCESSAEAA